MPQKNNTQQERKTTNTIKSAKWQNQQTLFSNNSECQQSQFPNLRKLNNKLHQKAEVIHLLPPRNTSHHKSQTMP